jgi:hypothetical protein
MTKRKMAEQIEKVKELARRPRRSKRCLSRIHSKR